VLLSDCGSNEGGDFLSRIQWEYDLIERPFCEQLKAMGWQWIESDTDVSELTERWSFREGLLNSGLTLLTGRALREMAT
jgi:hypothetical protein